MSKPVQSLGFDVPFTEAIAWAKDRVSVLPDIYYNDLPAQARSRAFTVSGLSALDQIQVVLDSLHKATESGETFAQWKKSLTPEVLALGPARLDNIFRTGIQTHYNIGRYEQQEANKAHRPYRMYDAINDGRTRPHHKALDNFIAPIDDAVWRTIYPPNGFRCRCSTISLTEAQAVQRGYKVGNLPDVNGGADKGWDYNPATGQDAKLEQIKAQRLAKVRDNAVREAAEKALHGNSEYWDKLTASGSWHESAFSLSSADIKGIVKRIGDPQSVLSTPKAHPHWAWGRHIEMDTLDQKTEYGHSVWRHEYGHHVDGASKVGGLRFWSSSDDFYNAMKSDSRGLVKNSAAGNYHAKATVERRAYLESVNDETRMLMLDSGDRSEWLRERYKANGIDIDQFADLMKRHSDFANTLHGVGLDNRYRRAIVAMENRDARGFIEAVAGDDGVERKLAYEKGSLGCLSDLIGSISTNKVGGMQTGYGHANAYYKNVENRGAESFANMFDLHGGKDALLWDKVIDAFAPKTNRAFKEFINGQV